MATWRKLIEDFLDEKGDTLVATTLSQAELDKEFNSGYGGSEGVPFTAWSEDWVYFPGVYDGDEWVDRVPRNPCDIKTNHIGGE